MVTKDAPEGGRYAVMEGLRQASESNPVVYAGGIVVLPRQPYLRTASEEAAKPRLVRTFVPEVIGATTRETLASTTGEELLPVMLRIDDHGIPDIQQELEEQIVRGHVQTVGDLHDLRAAVVVERQREIAARLEPVAEYIEQISGLRPDLCKTMGCMNAYLNRDQILALAEFPGVVRIDEDIEPGEPLENIDGRHVSEGTQIKQFLDDDPAHDGEYGASTDITFAIVDSGGLDDEHVGFLESSGGTSRIRGKYECDDSGCQSVADFTDEWPHATKCAGILFGDLRDDQDSGYGDPTSQLARSGYAGESRGWVYDAIETRVAHRNAMDHAIYRSPLPHVMNQSWGVKTEDTTCLGTTNMCIDANDLFESGVLLINAAGNTRGSSSDCTVWSPGTAIGVFTVGSHGDGLTGGSSDIKTDPIYDQDATHASSYGGADSNWDEGHNRTIIDLTAFGYRDLLFDASGGYSEEATGGTSNAAPTIAAGAIDFIDFYKTHLSSSIDNPGQLFVNLLLLGDRQGQGGKLSTRFDHLWGAGRFLMRKYDAPGMDAPWEYNNGWTCIDDSEEYTIPFAGGSALSSDINYCKAVIYWYDRRHEEGITYIDDIDLKLYGDGSLLASSSDANDNKERVFSTLVGGKVTSLKIIGYDVTADEEGCGTNSMKVYWAYFCEDSARNDGDGPGAEISPEG
ncbi:MAG: S8 family serine peptidase [Myxococcota bacterium]|nr:S8 family serine peptidase [Myxococcota bacterium]